MEKFENKHVLSLQKCDIWNQPQPLAKSQTSLMAPGNFTPVWKKERRWKEKVCCPCRFKIRNLSSFGCGNGWYFMYLSFCLICLTDFSPGLISSSSSSTHCTVALLQDLPQFIVSEIKHIKLSNDLQLICLSWSAAGPLPTIGADRPWTKSTAKKQHNIRGGKMAWLSRESVNVKFFFWEP